MLRIDIDRSLGIVFDLHFSIYIYFGALFLIRFITEKNHQTFKAFRCARPLSIVSQFIEIGSHEGAEGMRPKDTINLTFAY